MKQFRCVNFGHCQSADSGHLFPNHPGACPTCGQALSPIQRRWFPWLAAAAIVVLAIPVLLLIWHFDSRNGDPISNGGTGDFRKELSVSASKYFQDSRMVSLVEAALRNDAGTVNQLIHQGVPVNGQGNQGLTPLHLAMLNANLNAVSLLLEAGADSNLTASNRASAMTLAAMIPDSRFLAVALRHGGKADQRDGRQETPLMIAASDSLDENVRLLIEAGADVNAKDARDSTPLMHTFQSFKPNLNIARRLLAAGANPEARDPLGLTARDYAATFEDPALLEVFSK